MMLKQDGTGILARGCLTVCKAIWCQIAQSTVHHVFEKTPSQLTAHSKKLFLPGKIQPI